MGDVKIVIIGNSGVGKTSLLNRYINKKFDQNVANLDMSNFKKVVRKDDMEINVQFWDTAGQERFMSIGSHFFRNADAIALVYDVENPQSFDALEMWKEEFLVQSGADPAGGIPVVLIGNKSDLETKVGDDVQEWRAKHLNSNSPFEFHNTSALEGDNVDICFDKLSDMAIAFASPRFVNPGPGPGPLPPQPGPGPKPCGC